MSYNTKVEAVKAARHAGFVLLGEALVNVGPKFSSVTRQVRHYCQQTGFSCGAACLSMLTGWTEEDARKRARTRASGTFTFNVVQALRDAGLKAYHIQSDVALDRVLPELVIQSHSWPLYLSLEFRHEGKDRLGRRRGWTRHHACVLSQGRFLDPGSYDELDPEALGHLHEKGIFLNSYIILES